MAISWYNVSFTGNPKATLQAHTIHPSMSEIHRFPGRLPRRFAPRNDIFFYISDGSIPLKKHNVGGGGTPPPYEACLYMKRREGQDPPLRFYVVTLYHSSGGLPRQCAHWLAMTACRGCPKSQLPVTGRYQKVSTVSAPVSSGSQPLWNIRDSTWLTSRMASNMVVST